MAERREKDANWSEESSSPSIVESSLHLSSSSLSELDGVDLDETEDCAGRRGQLREKGKGGRTRTNA